MEWLKTHLTPIEERDTEMLNSPTKEQFMQRSGSFSTHGSRRGYSDLGLPMTFSDLLPPAERKVILLARLNDLNAIEKPSREVRIKKQEINNMLHKVTIEQKEYNINSAEKRESEMNFGRFFLDYCRKNMPKDYYLKLANGAREEFEKL